MTRLDARYPITPLLRSLAAFPSPEVVAKSVVRGPAGALGATTGSVWRRTDDELVAVSHHGLPDGVEDRYAVIPLRLQMPVAEAVSQNRIVAMALDAMIRDYPAVAMDADPWESSTDEADACYAVFSPICLEGLPIGGLALLCADRTSLDADDYTLIEGITAALALWLSHPGSRALPLQPRSGAALSSLTLTERQQQILRLVEEGRSNTQIAMQLGYSESTVKQELQRLLRLLRAGDRMAAVARAHDVGLI